MLSSIAQSVNIKASETNIPLSVLAEITYRCNVRCYYCYIRPDKNRAELNTFEWKDIIAQLDETGCLYLTISGGEPFIRDDLFDIIAEARERSFAVSLITNGTLIDSAKAVRLAELGVLDVGVSFHAAEPELHDRLTGHTGSYTAALEGLRHLIKQNVKVAIKHTLSQKNFGQFKALRKMAESEGALFEADSVVFPHESGGISPFAINEEQNKEFFEFMNMSPLPLSCGERGDDNLHCDAGRSVCGINPYGNVYPCVQLPMPFGNIRVETFEGIWKENNAKKFRFEEKSVSSECATCSVKKYCGRCPGVAWLETGEWQGSSSSLCTRAKAIALMAINE